MQGAPDSKSAPKSQALIHTATRLGMVSARWAASLPTPRALAPPSAATSRSGGLKPQLAAAADLCRPVRMAPQRRGGAAAAAGGSRGASGASSTERASSEGTRAATQLLDTAEERIEQLERAV